MNSIRLRANMVRIIRGMARWLVPVFGLMGVPGCSNPELRIWIQAGESTAISGLRIALRQGGSPGTTASVLLMPTEELQRFRLALPAGADQTPVVLDITAFEKDDSGHDCAAATWHGETQDISKELTLSLSPCTACYCSYSRKDLPTLNNIWGVSRDRIWIAGYSGTILSWDGVAWNTDMSSTTEDMNSLFGFGGRDVWGVGGTSTTGGVMLHWDGSSWLRVLSSKNVLYGLWGGGPNDVWVSGGCGVDRPGGCFELDHLDTGGALSPQLASFKWPQPDAPPVALLGMWGKGADALWVVGGSAVLPGSQDGCKDPTGWILRGTANGIGMDWTSWSPAQLGAYNLWGVWGSAEDDIWAVGVCGTIRHWNGTDWIQYPSASRNLWNVWGSDKNDVYIAGGSMWKDGDPRGILLHWDGMGWSSVSDNQAWNQIVDPKNKLFDVWGTGASDIWVVGDQGTILRYQRYSSLMTLQ